MSITGLLAYIKSNRLEIKGITDADVREIEVQLICYQDLYPEAATPEDFFTHNLKSNNFKIISKLIQARSFFSEMFLMQLREELKKKLEQAKIILAPPYGDFSKILYLKEGDFYIFLNQINSPDIEEELKDILKLLIAIYKQDSSSEMSGKSFIAMNNFVAVDQELAALINSNKFSSAVKTGPFLSKKVTYNLLYSVVIVFVVFRLANFVNELKFLHKVNTEYEMPTEQQAAPRKIDRYYTDMKFKIDSFFVFLADYNKNEIKQLTPIHGLKTGENPFETFYQSMPQGESNSFIRVSNNTNVDMILLENATVYDSIKLPKAAYYIKAGATFEVTKRETDAASVFNFYLGKKLASFQTNSHHVFIRNQSIIEYRFSELLPSTMTILKKDYKLHNDTTISLDKGVLKLH